MEAVSFRSVYNCFILCSEPFFTMNGFKLAMPTTLLLDIHMEHHIRYMALKIALYGSESLFVVHHEQQQRLLQEQ